MFLNTEKETLVGFAVGIGVGLCAALVFRQFRGVGIMKPKFKEGKTNLANKDKSVAQPQPQV